MSYREKNEGKMTSAVVRTKEELNKAYSEKMDEIIVVGELAKNIRDLERIKSFSPLAIGALITAGTAIAALTTVAPPIAAPLMFTAAETASFTTGLNISLIIIACSIGITLLIAIFKEYNLIEVEISKERMKIKLCKKN